MAEGSKIEWTDHTFNPWTGCTKISAACDHCYAEGWAKRSGHVEWGPHGERRKTKTWGEPVKWNKRLEGTGRRERVFCASLADVFDNHKSILPEWRRQLWHLIEDTQNLDWLLLTKRPQNVARFISPKWREEGLPDNVWLGVTVEDQAEANRRIPVLMSIPAKVRFLSMEPLLGPVNLRQLGGDHPGTDALRGFDLSTRPSRIHWVITGGESGHNSRPSNPQWFRDLRDQCASAGTPFLFKQWGDWVSVSEVEGKGPHHTFDDHRTVRRVGKSLAGRTLDGAMHDGVPV